MGRDGAGTVRSVDGHRHDGVRRGSAGDGGRRRRSGAGRLFGRHPADQRWPVARVRESAGHQPGGAAGHGASREFDAGTFAADARSVADPHVRKSICCRPHRRPLMRDGASGPAMGTFEQIGRCIVGQCTRTVDPREHHKQDAGWGDADECWYAGRCCSTGWSVAGWRNAGWSDAR